MVLIVKMYRNEWQISRPGLFHKYFQIRNERYHLKSIDSLDLHFGPHTSQKKSKNKNKKGLAVVDSESP